MLLYIGVLENIGILRRTYFITSHDRSKVLTKNVVFISNIPQNLNKCKKKLKSEKKREQKKCFRWWCNILKSVQLAHKNKVITFPQPPHPPKNEKIP